MMGRMIGGRAGELTWMGPLKLSGLVVSCTHSILGLKLTGEPIHRRSSSRSLGRSGDSLQAQSGLSSASSHQGVAPTTSTLIPPLLLITSTLALFLPLSLPHPCIPLSITPIASSIPPFSLWNLPSGATTQSFAILANPSIGAPMVES